MQVGTVITREFEPIKKNENNLYCKGSQIVLKRS